MLFSTLLCFWSAFGNAATSGDGFSRSRADGSRVCMYVTTHALDMVAKRAHAWTEYTCRCERVHASPIAGARARASRAFFSNAVVVGRGGVAEVEDVHVEENHAAELVHGEKC